MSYRFTPAAERALAAAAACTGGGEFTAIGLPEALWGLLGEPDSRAALLLATHAVDRGRLAARWPHLAHPSAETASPPLSERRLSVELRAALDWARERLWEHPQPLELSTEHLLLGILGSTSETSQWLRQLGLEPEQVEADIHRAAGQRPGPLDWSDASAPSGLAPRAEPAADRGAPGPGDVVADTSLTGPAAASVVPEPSGAGPLLGGDAGSAVWRIVDAAANRAAEGLRVVEDYLRLALDDRHLTGLAKAARHALAEIVDRLPIEARLAGRDTRADVGTVLTTAGEQARHSMADVAQANLKRAEQALRSLEEYSKLAAPHAAARFEQLRYSIYTLERAIGQTTHSLARLATARLYVLTDGCESAAAFQNRLAALVEGGADLIQLRDKRLPDRELLARARQLVACTRGTATLAIINDRPDVAALARADGVHLGQDELRVKDARAILGVRPLVGVSTHSLDQAREAVLDGASYLGVGPIFPSSTKAFRAFPGLELARQVAAEIRLPAFAIGGITAENLPLLLETGVTRIAVSGAVVGHGQPADAARQLQQALALAASRRSTTGGGPAGTRDDDAPASTGDCRAPSTGADASGAARDDSPSPRGSQSPSGASRPASAPG